MSLKHCFIIACVCFIHIAFASPPDNPSKHSGTKQKTITAVDFTLKDTLGNSVSLHNYLGKFVVISMGAGWCGSCMAEVDATKKLQNHFADRNDIVWLFINFDKDQGSWANTRRIEKLKGEHLWGRLAKEDLKKLFNFNQLPYYIWIDKEGNVVKKDAPRPSDELVRISLSYYLKQGEKKLQNASSEQ